MNYKKPLVSVIIPVKNGASTISQNLGSLINQTYKNIEIIVVDNFSTDETSTIVGKYLKRHKRIKFYKKGPERAAQMNFGIRRALGRYVFITNSDMVVDKNFIKLAVKKCEEEGFDACNGHIKSKTKGFWSKVKGLERQMYVNDKLMETALFYKKDTFLKLGGFDEKMLGVEEEFQHKLDENNYKTGIIDSFQTHIDEIDSFRQIVLKSFYYGLYDAAYFEKRPTLAFRKRFPIRSAFFRNFGLLINRLDLFAGFVLFKVVQYTAGTIGLILGLLFSPKKNRIQNLIYERPKTS